MEDPNIISSKIIEAQENANNKNLIFCSILIFVQGIGFGCSFAHGSLILPHQMDNASNITENSQFKLTDEEGSWSISLSPALSLIGTLASTPAGEILGRKIVLICSSIIATGSFIIIFFSNSFGIFILGRCLLSFSRGLGITMMFVMISEMTTIKLRGFLSNIVLCSISYGVATAYVGTIFFNIEYVIYIMMIFPAIFLIFSPFLPESPHWLIRKGKIEGAKNSYKFLRGLQYSGTEMEIEEVKHCMTLKNLSLTKPNRWSTHGFLRPLFILMAMFTFIALSGVDAPLNLYSPMIFQKIGLDLPAEVISALIPVGESIGYTLAFPLMTRVNRRPLYMFSSLFMCISSIILSGSFYLVDYHSVPSWAFLVLQTAVAVSSFTFMFFYGLGFGAVTYAVPGEILSPDDKSIGISISQATRLIFTFTMLKNYPFLMKKFGLSILFGYHAIFTILAILFCWRFLPETRNKSIVEILHYFNKHDTEKSDFVNKKSLNRNN